MAPPYVNPLTAERAGGLRISEIRIEHLQDGSIDAEKAATAAALVRAHLNERLADKLAPEKGNAVLVVQLQLLFLKESRWWFETGRVRLELTAKIVGLGISAEYNAVSGRQAVSPTNRGWEVASPGEHLPPMARGAADRLAQQILCCAMPALRKQPT
jgi:hypothetical protein